MSLSDDFNEQDRVTDTIMWLSSDVNLTFVTQLYYKQKDGTRRSFHSEVHRTSEFPNADVSRYIRRNCKFYFVLGSKSNWGDGLIFKPGDVFVFTKAIEEKVMPWFFGPTRIYSQLEDRLAITGKCDPFVYRNDEYRYISFVPIVLEYPNHQYKEGLRVFLNNQDNMFDIDIDTFLNLYWIMKNTDMLTYSSTMMNYAKTPPYGINVWQSGGLGSGFDESNIIPYQPNSKPSANNFLNNSKKAEDK
jgi:hypothetical protein